MISIINLSLILSVIMIISLGVKNNYQYCYKKIRIKENEQNFK